MFDPWTIRNIANLQGQMNQAFQQAGNRQVASDQAYDAVSFQPAVDVIEDGDDLVLRAELPGVAKEDVDVNVENSTLFLRGEKRPDPKRTPDAYRRTECAYGKFARHFQLPRTVDTRKIEAHFKDGVLEVRLPKAEGALPKKIQVN